MPFFCIRQICFVTFTTQTCTFTLKKHIPNLVTLLNLLSGCIAVLFATNGDLTKAAFFALLGIFFDFFDGLLARKLKVQSELGLQLDSLADVVTSGLVPGIVMYQLIKLAGRQWSEPGNILDAFKWDSEHLLPFVGLLITLASAYRLAKFNISTNQSEQFVGLPTPANTMLILSFPLILAYHNSDAINSIILNQWFLIAVTVVSSILLNSRMKLLALKFKDWSFKNNAARYLLIILSAVLLVIFQFAAIPLIILLYLIISILNR